MEWKGIRGQILNSVLMKRYTSMKVGGPARYMVYPADEADLSTVLAIARHEGIGCRFLGNGTNIIVADKGLDEAIIRITRLRRMHVRKTSEGAVVEVSGGVSLRHGKVMRHSRDSGGRNQNERRELRRLDL
jgi:UDP-N-acetylmuramate dehydrogenase